MSKEIRAVTFDAFGTLFRLRTSAGEEYRQVAARHGLEFSAQAMDGALRRAWKDGPTKATVAGPRPDDDRGWWQELVFTALDFAGVQTDPASKSRYFDELYEWFARPDPWELFPDTRNVLDELRSRMPIAVLSNFDRRLYRILDGLQIRDVFSAVIISSEVGADKPAPAIFEAMVAALGLAPETILHVGDDPVADLRGAKAAGFQSALFAAHEQNLRDVLQQAGLLP